MSAINFKKFSIYGKTNIEILENAFIGHIIEKENGQKYIWNIIVNSGSEISKILLNYYEDPKLIPLNDFSIE